VWWARIKTVQCGGHVSRQCSVVGTYQDSALWWVRIKTVQCGGYVSRQCSVVGTYQDSAVWWVRIKFRLKNFASIFKFLSFWLPASSQVEHLVYFHGG